jgi:ribosomal protein L37AE/L43A
MIEKQIDRVVLDAELSVDAVIPGHANKAWLCPACGLRWSSGNYQKCSRMTQIKHQRERGQLK